MGLYLHGNNMWLPAIAVPILSRGGESASGCSLSFYHPAEECQDSAALGALELDYPSAPPPTTELLLQ